MTDQFNIFEQEKLKEGLTDEEFAVWRIVSARRGRDKAIKVSQLAWETRLTEQRVREIVSHLVREHKKMIASSTANPPGFYVIKNAEELRTHIRSLRHRGIMCLVRAAELAKTSIEDVFNQGRLELKKENADGV